MNYAQQEALALKIKDLENRRILEMNNENNSIKMESHYGKQIELLYWVASLIDEDSSVSKYHNELIKVSNQLYENSKE